VTGDLADERLDAVRHGTQRTLFRQRLVRLLLGIPADLSWRLVDAPAMARDLSLQTDWVPPNRWSLALLGIVAVGTAGALGIVTLPYLSGQVSAEVWPGWGRYGFTLSSIAVLVGIVLAVPWPHLGLRLVLAGVVVGFFAAPWLWGCWFLALIAVVVRRHLAGGPGTHR